MKVWYEAGVWGDNLSRCELVLEIKLSQSNLKLGRRGFFFFFFHFFHFLFVAVDSLTFRNMR